MQIKKFSKKNLPKKKGEKAIFLFDDVKGIITRSEYNLEYKHLKIITITKK